MAIEYVCDGCDAPITDVERKRVEMNFFDAQPPSQFDLCMMCFMSVNPRTWKRAPDPIVKELPQPETPQP